MIFRHLLNMRSHPTWVRGLKLKDDVIKQSLVVAPYVGAWIETRTIPLLMAVVTSHPTWVRGLKHRTTRRDKPAARSHPTWVRGLKLCRY